MGREEREKMERVYLALGANIGDRVASLRGAVERLGAVVKIDAMSRIYETDAAYVVDQPRFLNAVVRGETELKPLALLEHVKRIETEVGRRPTFRYGPRVIDIDILFYGDEDLSLPDLVIPHALFRERSFVLRPLMDIAPDYIDSMTGKTVRALYDLLPIKDDLEETKLEW